MNIQPLRKNSRKATIKDKRSLENLSTSPDILASQNLQSKFPVKKRIETSLTNLSSIKSQLKLQLKALKDNSIDNYSTQVMFLLSNYSKPETPILQVPSKPEQSPRLGSPLQSARHVKLKPILKLSNHVSRAGFKSIGNTLTGNKKVYSTSIFIKPSFQNTKGEYLFGLTEGHGKFASLLARFVAAIFPNALEALIPQGSSLDKISSALSGCDNKILEELKNNEKEIQFSGCSISALLVYGEAVFVINIGDCQSVLAKFNGSWTSLKLNQVHDLRNAEERKRVLSFGAKVYLEKDGDCLAAQEKFSGTDPSFSYRLTRSIGDTSGIILGITSEPEVSRFLVKPEDKFIIIGNSNFWKVVDQEEAVSLAVSGWNAGKTDLISEALINEAKRRINPSQLQSSEFSIVVIFLSP